MTHNHKQKAMDAKLAVLEQRATRRLENDEELREILCNRAAMLAEEELEKHKKVNGACG